MDQQRAHLGHLLDQSDYNSHEMSNRQQYSRPPSPSKLVMNPFPRVCHEPELDQLQETLNETDGGWLGDGDITFFSPCSQGTTSTLSSGTAANSELQKAFEVMSIGSNVIEGSYEVTQGPISQNNADTPFCHDELLGPKTKLSLEEVQRCLSSG